jgi:methylenetetrahydrofolate dehydrogenase (NADP+)/methenyltetrahydrofolate cyclohydrolase
MVNNVAVILDGKALALEIRAQIKTTVGKLVEKYHVVPHLAVILIGEDPASQSYVKGKEAACQKAGIKSTVIQKPVTISEAELLTIIAELNADTAVHGILLQLPIPKHLDPDKIIALIDKHKDVDGFTPENVAALTNGRPRLVPCTPLGIIKLLKKYDIPIAGKHCVIIGRSTIVGKPMAALLLKENGTITICHTKTTNLPAITNQADILVVATGQPKMINGTHVKDGAVVIDVGISKIDGVICGDVDYESVYPKSAFITPVPGGVGPLTIACLLENCIKCYQTFMEGNHD